MTLFFLLCLLFEKGEVSFEVCGFGFGNLWSNSCIAVIFFLTVNPYPERNNSSLGMAPTTLKCLLG